jgi:hypothetical protein
MREPYEDYFRHVRRRHRAQVALLVGAAVLMMVAVITLVLVAEQVPAGDHRTTTAFDVTPIR